MKPVLIESEGYDNSTKSHAEQVDIYDEWVNETDVPIGKFVYLCLEKNIAYYQRSGNQ